MPPQILTPLAPLPQADFADEFDVAALPAFGPQPEPYGPRPEPAALAPLDTFEESVPEPAALAAFGADLAPAPAAQPARPAIALTPATPQIPMLEPPPAPGQDPVRAERELRAANVADRARTAYAPAEQATTAARDFDAAGEDLGRQWLEKQRQISAATDPKERERLVAEASGIETQARAVQIGSEQARLDADVALARGDAELEVAARDLTLLRREEVADQIGQERAKRQAQVEQLRADRALAQQRVQQRRDSAAALLRKQAQDDPATTWSSVASLIGELTAAYAQRRAPNLDGAIQTVLELGRERLAKQREAAGAEIDAAEGELGDIGRDIADIEAEGAARDAAILDQAEQALDLELAKARGTPREVAVFRAQEAVRVAREQSALEASSKQSDAISRQRQAEAEVRLKNAQAAKAQAEANRLARRGAGGGAGGAPGSGTLAPNVVTLPGTNTVVATFPNNKLGRERAAQASGLVAAQTESLRLLNEYEAMLEDYGQRGLFDNKDFARTGEYARLEAARQAIVGPLAKIYAGGFNPSVSMEERAEKAVALPEGWWQREGVATASVAELRRQAEEGFREKAITVGLAPDTVETVITFRRARGESQRDRAAKLMKNAETVITDADAKEPTRLRAVDALVERVKGELGEGATGASWAPAALLQLRQARSRLAADDAPAVGAALDKKIAEIETLWREVGRSGLEVTAEERKRQREAETDRRREFPRTIR